MKYEKRNPFLKSLLELHKPKPTPERERFFCSAHGDISTLIHAGKTEYGPYTPNGFCPHCLGDWLEKQFPISRGSA